jgi:hypothetical protein
VQLWVDHRFRGRGFQIVLSRIFVGDALLPFISALEVATAQVFYFPAAANSSAVMKGGAPPTKLLDKTIWNTCVNTRPVFDLAPRAVVDVR